MTIFSKIISGEIPSYNIAESDDYLAFLDIAPLAEGHVLVIPKIEVDNLFDLEEGTYLGLMVFAQLVAQAIQKSIPCKKVGVAVIGLEVPHAHIHLIPINQVNDMNFSRPKLQFTPEQFEEIANRIKAAL